MQLMSLRLIVTPALSAFAVFAATAAFAGIDIIAKTDLGAAKHVEAAVINESDDVVATVIYTQVETGWQLDECETLAAEDAMWAEAPNKLGLQMWAATTTDCNHNGIPDSQDIAAGAMDWNQDGVPDSCSYAAGDLNLNGVVDGQDLSILLGWWGISNPLVGDLNGDGKVDGGDMGILLARYGAVVFQ
jgi:hypothetical protein